MTKSITNAEKKIVAYLKPAGTFTHEVAMKRFGKNAEYIPAGVEDIFKLVKNKEVEYGVIPIANSNKGPQDDTLDLFLEYCNDKNGMWICEELEMKINQNLIAHPDYNGKPEKIMSHPNALGQCKDYLKENYSGIKQLEVITTAQAVKLLNENPQSLAIASYAAADLYKMNLIDERIQDDKGNNKTRFAVIGRTEEKYEIGNDYKTSLTFSVPDESGGLYSALGPIANNKINMCYIYSRPVPKTDWHFLIYVDIEAHRDEEKVRRALETMKEHWTTSLHVFGSYKKVIMDPETTNNSFNPLYDIDPFLL